MSDELPMYRPRCKFLNCKSMMVYGEDFESDPEYQAGSIEFWCDCTTRGMGPDGDSVGLEECSVAERSCFAES
jgi:hypothetical protein